MPGVLEEIFNVRTNGNGYVETKWNDILLKKDLRRLIAEGRIREFIVSSEMTEYQDRETGEIYEYHAAWERGCPRFNKAT
jgi:hypothetical protein